MSLLRMIHNLHEDESGQDLLEYALVLFAIAAAAVTGSNSLASTITSTLSKLNTKISSIVS